MLVNQNRASLECFGSQSQIKTLATMVGGELEYPQHCAISAPPLTVF